MKNGEGTNKLEKRLRKLRMVLNFIFILIMIWLLDLLENRWSMNKLWMQLIFVAVYSIIWGKGSEAILEIVRNRIENKTENSY
ncbi:MAG: hypothetical protein LUI13_03490 [Lachnospiraceae bacterium]|nr:hypothetical protein [Lachnospiraceae bacterium]MCD7744342.1 hypothetical protein [Lachnospiraceae bacterium]